MSGARLPRPGSYVHNRALLRERVLRALRAAPMTGGALRARFAGAAVDDVVREFQAEGLVVRGAGGDLWLTPAGRIADRGPVAAGGRVATT